ncbi:hypothetical protein CPB84DRAFT_1851318 [Gymnopilus junonius]|uniref:Uncharacterized protein n=1 Tax=Gymnopilus junonius TaxID=109634 RepID=A0A9P5TJ38_GYMJU|nr:hypothetical protein CPB84DRAFT_1851318 [Gymnopilus junonius]
MASDGGEQENSQNDDMSSVASDEEVERTVMPQKPRQKETTPLITALILIAAETMPPHNEICEEIVCPHIQGVSAIFIPFWTTYETWKKKGPGGFPTGTAEGHLEKGSTKVKENGEIESASEIEERMIVDRERLRRSHAQQQEEDHGLIAEKRRLLLYLEWLLDLVETLGEDGMSSDESEIDDRTATVIYRVKNMPWRRTISEEMDLIDKQRATAHIFSKKGSKPMRGCVEGGVKA